MTKEQFSQGIKNCLQTVKSFFQKGLSEGGDVSSKRVVLWYVAIVLWTFLHAYVFFSPMTDKTINTLAAERASLINLDFWIIVSGTGMILSEKFANKL